VADPEERVLERERLGEPARGVVVEAQLLGAGSPAVVVELQAVLVTADALAGRVESIRRAKVALCEAPGAREPTARVQVDPGLPEGAQDQPEALAAASKRVKGGMVSEISTAAAGATPAFRTVRV